MILMRKASFLWLILILIGLPEPAAQVKVGEWREHLSYRNVKDLILLGEKAYAVTESGLFIYNTRDNSIEKLSKLKGLSDFGISSLEALPAEDVILLGYSNGNVDIIRQNQIQNYNEIKEKLLFGSKSVNNIVFHEGLAYLACGFGIVVFDWKEAETRASYHIGPQGKNVVVKDVSFEGNTIYASTEEGLYKADITNPNLLDYRNWNQTMAGSGAAFSQLESFNGKVLAVQEGASYDSLFVFEEDAWRYVNTGINKRIHGLNYVNGRLLISYAGLLLIYDKNLHPITSIAQYQVNETFRTIKEEVEKTGANPRQAMIDKKGTYWIADYSNGLIQYTGNEARCIYPNGPYNNHSYSLHIHNGRVWLAGGGIIGSNRNHWYQGEVYLFHNNSWKNYRYDRGLDFLQILNEPGSTDRLYAASWGRGVYILEGEQILQEYGPDNYPQHSLQSAISPTTPYYRVSSVAFDRWGNLWAANSIVSHLLSVMEPDGSWTGFNLGEKMEKYHTGELLINRFGHKWLGLKNIDIPGGILVFSEEADLENKEDDRYTVFQIRSETGELISNSVYSLAEDKNGYIWVGTDKGVYVYYNPSRVFERDFYASSILIPRNDGTNIADRLLETEVITDIEIDGANRKWFGTQNSGAYLFSEDGTKEIHHFSSGNSPLLDDYIYDIAVDGNSGEVFIATVKGLISYRGMATEDKRQNGKTYVFPNPVRPEYEGPIVIKGLIADANVKITDISGNLVYETTTLGGQAIWYGKNMEGREVSSGVYLIFCTTEDGSETQMAKVLVIN